MPTDLFNAPNSYSLIQESLRQLYVGDTRPWLVGFSGGKDSTMLASLVFDTVLSIPPEERRKEIAVVCTDTRVEIPAIAKGTELTPPNHMRRFFQQGWLKTDTQCPKPPFELPLRSISLRSATHRPIALSASQPKCGNRRDGKRSDSK